MDNILKLLLGVLGLAGLIAMVTPTNIALAPEDALPPANPAVAVGPPPPQNGGGIPTEEQLNGEEPPEPDADDFAIGEPTIDGNPIGANNDQQQQMQQQQQQQQQDGFPAAFPGTNFSYAQPDMQAYMPPVTYSPQQPDLGTFGPVDSGQ